MTEEIQSIFNELQEEIKRNADADKAFQVASFFELFSETAADAGDVPDLNSVTILHEGSKSYKVDGYAFDMGARELILAIVDYDSQDVIRGIDKTTSDSFFKKCFRFFEKSMSKTFIDELEETSDAFALADQIYSKREMLKRIRIVLFTNAKSVLRSKIEAETKDNIYITKNLFDITRYSNILQSKGGSEPISIDLREFSHGPIPCLKTVKGAGDYQSYLCVMPGPLLADIYSMYSSKLLEQNVRVFLQARTKVNKGIIETIATKPEMFFAYNNGLTVTASSIETSSGPSGELLISKFENLQIVNGGQTTASILYARDISKSDLSAVSVQMKLSVIPEESLEREVPTISRYSNMQNKISEADLSSSHPYHSFMEKTAQRMLTPVQEGTSTGSKWFYERARGQYRNRQTYMSSKDKNRFLREFPKDQVLLKTDIAKYEMSIHQRPDLVSQGAQKCFKLFSDGIAKDWEKSQNTFNDLYFQKVIAHSILFRKLDSHIAKSQWYKDDRGYKAQIVTYTIAYFAYWLEKNGQSANTQSLWKKQDIDYELMELLDYLARYISKFIKEPPAQFSNISEYCKRPDCWKALRQEKVLDIYSANDFGLSKSEEKYEKKEAVKKKKIDNVLEFEMRLMQLVPKAREIKIDANRLKLLTHASNSGLDKLSRGAMKLSFSEQTALKELLSKLSEYNKAY